MNNECWTEIDIYWFQEETIEEKVTRLFDRITPVWQLNPEARKGLSLCAGWLFDSVLSWNRDWNAPIVCCQPPVYEVWTYRRLAELILRIKREAIERKIYNFHVALILLASESMDFDHESSCEGCVGRTEDVKDKNIYKIKGDWFLKHAEIDRKQFGLFYMGSIVNVPEHEQVCSLPEPTFGQYFADKLCDLAAEIGLDGVVLRDHVFVPAYSRGNASGLRYQDPERSEEWTDSFIQLFSRIKSKLPSFLIIGYDSGASSIEEWRSHGFDLEKVASAGDLDIWITQTWASAWQDYWPAHSLGYTFQLTNVLVDLAMLSETPCKSIFLIETFDAWEPWDAVNQYPHKLMWEIWAYSHAALLKPDGVLHRSDGFYMSWMNKRDVLLPEEAVSFLCHTLKDCNEDIKRNPAPCGPAIIYHRKGLEELIHHPKAYSSGEEIDDWASMLIKYGTPILSITRSEWLHRVESDGLIFPAPANMDNALEETLLGKLRKGVTIVFTGQASLLPDRIRHELNIKVSEDMIMEELPSAAVVSYDLAKQIGIRGVVINQRIRTLEESPGWDTLISCLEGPVFAKHKSLPCWIWETPEWGTLHELSLTNHSIQSPQTYVAVSHAINAEGWGMKKYKWINADWQKPMCMLMWRYPNGTIAVLTGNLETGITGNSQYGVKGWLCSTSMEELENYIAHPEFAPGKVETTMNEGLHIKLAGHKSGIIYNITL